MMCQVAKRPTTTAEASDNAVTISSTRRSTGAIKSTGRPNDAISAALGARALDVRRMVLRDAAVLVSIGAVAGLGFALWAGRALETLLFGVGRSDYVSLIASAALLSVAGLLASWVPARRASRVDPVVALREG